jgi:tight adherence protein B
MMLDFNDWFLILLWGTAISSAVYYVGQVVMLWYASYEEQFVQRTEQDLYGMFSALSPQRIFQTAIALFFVFFAVTLFLVGQFHSNTAVTLSITFAALVGLGASLIPRFIIKKAAEIRIKKFNLQLLDALLTMSNSLKAGFSIIQTFEAIVNERRDPISQEFDLMLKEIRLGVKFEVAAENLSRRVPSEDLQIVLTGIETARQTGGNLTEVFDRLAYVIRERMRVEGRIQSLTAQGRLQGWAIGLLPFFLAIALYYLEPDLMRGFVQSPAGLFLILIMLGFLSIGAFFIRKIIKIDV